MSERIPCNTEGCKATVLPSTFAKTGGYCMPCYQAIQKKEWEDYVKKNRRDIDLYKGVTDNAEILKIMTAEKKYNPLINYIEYPKSVEEVYALLLKDDIEKVIGYIISLIEQENIDTVEEIMLHTACFTNVSLERCIEILLKKKHYYPAIVF